MKYLPVDLTAFRVKGGQNGYQMKYLPVELCQHALRK